MKKISCLCLVFCLLLIQLAGCVTPPAPTRPVEIALSSVALTATASEHAVQLSGQVQIDPSRVLLVESAEPVLFDTPGATVSVDGFGAVADDEENDAQAIQKALDHVKTGGTVYFPAGIYRIEKTLLFYSDQTLLFAPGAVLQRSDAACRCLLTNSREDQGGYDATQRVNIIGAVFDGGDFADAPVILLSHSHARQINVIGCSFRNGNELHYYDCNASADVRILSCTFEDSFQNANAMSEYLHISAAGEESLLDGLPYKADQTACSDVVVSGCRFDAQKGRNSIALGNHEDGGHSNIRIHGCTLLGGNSAKAAITFGGGVSDVYVAENLFSGSSRCVMATNDGVRVSVDNDFYGIKTALFGKTLWDEKDAVREGSFFVSVAEKLSGGDALEFGETADLGAQNRLLFLPGSVSAGDTVFACTEISVEAYRDPQPPQSVQWDVSWLNETTLQLTFGEAVDLSGASVFSSAQQTGILYETPGPVVNVLDYGAEPDDAQFDSAKLQAAIDAVKDGGTVIFPAGVYCLDRCLAFYSNQTLLFMPGAVLKRSTYTGAGTLLMNYYTADVGGYSAVENVNIIGATFDGNPEIDKSCNLLNTFHAKNINVIGCVFHNCNYWHCYECNSSANIRVVDCVFEDKYFALQNRSEYFQIDRAGIDSISNLFDTEYMTFDNTSCTNILVANTIFDSTTSQAVGLGNHSPYAHHGVYVTGCTFLGGYPIRGAISFSEGMEDVYVTGNTFRDMSVGLDCSSGKNLNVYADNIFENVEQILRGDFQEAEGEGPRFVLPQYLSQAKIEKTGENTYTITFPQPWNGEEGNILICGALRSDGSAAGEMCIAK